MLNLNSNSVPDDYPSMPISEHTATTFNAKLLHPIILTAKHYRLPLTDLLAQLNIDVQNLDTPGQRYPTSTLALLLESLSKASNNPAFAIRAAEATQPRMLGNTGFAMCTASTFLEAYQTLSNYSALAFEGINLKLSTREHDALIVLESTHHDDYLTAFFVGCLCNWSRWLTGSQIPVKAIELSLAHAKFINLEQHLATEIQFEQSINQIIFDQRYLNTPCVEANSDMYQLHCQYADTLLLQVPQSNTIISQTKVQIRQLITLNEHSPTPIRREEVAKRLNMSLRTLQRKLHSAQSNFQDVYDQVRRESCLALIANNTFNLGQISYRLGFANSSALQKAFKRWMNTTPSAYRQQLLSNKQNRSQQESKDVSVSWYTLSKDVEKDTRKRLAQLSEFSTLLLSWLACFKHCQQDLVAMQDLGRLTNSSIARLSIYLWPAQQQELLIIHNENSELEASLCQLQPDQIGNLLHNKNPQLCADQHFQIALMLIDQGLTDKAVRHFSECHESYLNDDQCKILYIHCEKLKQLQPEQLSLRCKADLLSIMLRFSDRVNNPVEHFIALKFSLLQCQIQNQQWQLCQHLIAELKQQPLSQEQSLLLCVYHAELMIAHYRFDEALALLLAEISQLLPPLSDNDANSTLINIALQIENLTPSPENQATQQQVDHQVLGVALQKLILIALKARKPLIAANATCALLPLVSDAKNHYLRAFAYSHFSWICSWFGGHTEAAYSNTQNALKFLSDVDNTIYLDCIYVLYSRVYHWFTPFDNQINKLNALLEQTTTPSVEHQILLQQMRLCSGVPINSILNECSKLNQHKSIENEQSQAFSSTLTQLCRKLIDNSVVTVQPESPNDDFYSLFHAFYTQDLTQWERLKFSAKDIENATPSHFIAIEANFICLVMQIQSLELHQNSLLINRKIEAELARFEIWAQQCPENFAAPFALAKAIYASKSQSLSQASMLFEQALNLLNQSGYLHHLIIAYRYYAKLLESDKPHLSMLCEQHHQALYNRWIAVEISD